MLSTNINEDYITVTSHDYTWYSFNRLRVKKLEDNAILPKKANESDAGYDLYSIEDKIVEPKQRIMIRTGISMAIPNNYVGLIWPRSGLAVKHGIDVLAGVVDSGYRGEVCVILQNHGSQPHEIKAGDRIAQILFQKIESFQLEEVETLEEADRGDSGFGSTGA